MRVSRYALSEFVPAHFTVPENPFYPGMAGVAEFVAASFALPQNPIGMGYFVDASFTVPENPIAGMGDLVGTQALWPIPMNSVLAQAHAQGLAGLGGGDCGCGCGGECSGGLSGISDFVTQTMDKLKAGDPMTIALIAGGGLLAAWLLFGMRSNRSAYRDAKAKARAKYRADLAQIRGEYPTAAGRVRRAAAAF